MENHFEAEISAELKEFMRLNSIQSLDALLKLPDEKYHKMAAFTWHILKEILRLRKIQ